MNLINNKRALRDCCLLVIAARKHLGLDAKLFHDGDGNGHIEIGSYCVIPETGTSLQKPTLWQVSVATTTYCGHWDAPECDILELGDVWSWEDALLKIAVSREKDRLTNLLGDEAEYRASKEAEHYERLMSS